MRSSSPLDEFADRRRALRFAKLDHFIRWASPRCSWCKVTFFASEISAHRATCQAMPEPRWPERMARRRAAQRARRAAYLRETWK